MTRIKTIIPSLTYFIGFVAMFSCIISFKIVFLGIILLGLPFIFELTKYILNHKGPLVIKTPDGSDQPYHPSVLFFEDGWNGYKYWMAYTPFPIGASPYRDRWEYPCVCVSNDGIIWNDANGNKPLDDLTENQIMNKDYFSDTHLVYNREENRIECYYRLSEEEYFHNNEKGVWLFRRYTYDGKMWSDREISISGTENGPHGDGLPCISPSIIKKEKYQMWYVINENQKYTIYYSASVDGIEWSKGIQCKLKGITVNPWHIDCKYYGNSYYILIYDFLQKITLWKSEDGINFVFEKIMLKASHNIGDFYKVSLYRSCMLEDKDGYKIYFSAGNDREVKIGLMKGVDLQEMSVYKASNRLSAKDFFIDYFEKYFFLERWVVWKCKRKLNIKTNEWF